MIALLRLAFTRPLTPRIGDMAVLWTCLIIGVGAFLLNVGFFGA